MSTTTPYYNLFKYDTVTDSQSPFNITTALNNNWDKIDTALNTLEHTIPYGVLTLDDLSPVTTISETYVNGTSWYRVWSDGWCEQGGKIDTTAFPTVVNLIKAYKDTNFNVSATINFYNSTETRFYFDAGAASNSSVNIGTRNINGAFQGSSVFWTTKGYIN